MSGLVYHYTSERQHLPLILQSGELRPSNAGAEHQEAALLWFSRNPRFEATACKLWRSPDGSTARHLTFQEQYERAGWCRFCLPADDARLMPWLIATRYVGMGLTERRKLERWGRERGATPSHWLACAEAIPVRSMNLERFDGARWVAMEAQHDAAKQEGAA